MGYAASLQLELCVWCDEGVQKRLLTKADLTFAKVLEAAEIAEMETKDAQNSCRVSQNRNKTEVHQVAAPPRRGRPSGLARGLQQVWRSA